MAIGKKSEGLSMTTIIIAAIALIVLVVLTLIFSGRMSFFSKSVQSCPPNSDGPLDACPDGKLPVKVIQSEPEGGTGQTFTRYCCPRN